MQPSPSKSRDPFFYDLLENDKAFVLLESRDRLDPEGVVIPLSSPIDPKVFDLDEESYVKIRSLLEKSMHLPGRKNELSPGIDHSIGKICRQASDSALKTGKKIEILIRGIGILYVVASMIPKILDTWCPELIGNEVVLTSSFRKLSTTSSHTFKWEFRTRNETNEESGYKLFQESILEPLVDKFKKLQCNPSDLAILLAEEKKSNRSPYFLGLTRKYGPITREMSFLSDFCIEAFLFTVAADAESFKLRRFTDREVSHDCIFPNNTGILATAKESLFIDITPCIDKKFTGNLSSIRSMQGDPSEKVLQALSDNFLLLITFDPNLPVEVSDFTRTISHFTTGGRCYQKGWLTAIVNALKEHCIDRDMSLSKVLEQQLITRSANHHRNEPSDLIALTFNASALLYKLDHETEGEIQKLWQLIFAYLDKLEDKPKSYLRFPVIEKITIVMRNPDSKFKDLYHTYIQIASQIDQNRTRNMISYPTQTDGLLFSQWEMVPEENASGRAHRNPIVLFFPFELSSALGHIATLRELPSPIPLYLDAVASDKTLNFRFGQSKLSRFTEDPRRTYSTSLASALLLSEKKQEAFWQIGFLSTLSLLALRHDSYVLKTVLEKFIAMLKSNWASCAIKQTSINLFCRTLKENNITIPPAIFQSIVNKNERRDLGTYIRLIVALLKTEEPSFLDYAYEQFKLIEVGKYDYRTLKDAYTNLLDHSVTCIKNASDSSGITGGRRRWLNELLRRIIRDLLPEHTLRLLCKSYVELQGMLSEQDPQLEEKLFESILNALEQMKKVSDPSPIDSDVWIFLTTSQNRSVSLLKTIRLLKALDRLRLWNLTEEMQSEKIALIDRAKTLDLSLYFRIAPTSDEIVEKHRQIDLSEMLSENPVDVEKLFYFMHLSIAKKRNFEELHRLFDEIRDRIFHDLSFARRSELCDLLVNFHNKFFKKYGHLLYKCLLSFLPGETDSFLKSRLLERIYISLKHSEYSRPVSDSDYRDFIRQTDALSSQERSFLRYESEKFLRELAARKMDHEIFAFCESAGSPPITTHPENFSIYIAAIQNKKVSTGYPVSIETLEDLLLHAPFQAAPSADLYSHLTDIYRFLTLSRRKPDSMIEAYQWFLKESKIRNKVPSKDLFDRDYYLRTLDFANELIKSKYYSQAYHVTSKISFLPAYRVRWLEICLLFLKNNQIRYCNLLLNNKIFLNNFEDAELWQQLFNHLILNSMTLTKADDKELLSSVYTNMQTLFKNTPTSSKTLLMNYFHASAFNGPLNTVEEAFTTLFKLPFTEEERNKCKSQFLQRFRTEGSKLLLTDERCWPEIETIPDEMSLQILLTGALKACQVNGLDPKFYPKQIEKMILYVRTWHEALNKKFNANPIYNLYSGTFRFTNLPFYYLAALLSYSTHEEDLIVGADCITGILTTLGPKPLFIKKVIHLTTVFTDKISKVKKISPDAVDAISEVILGTINNAYCKGPDYIKFIQFLNTIGPPTVGKFQDRLINALIQKEPLKEKNGTSFPFCIRHSNQYQKINFYIQDILARRILENPWIKNCRLGSKDQETIGFLFRETLRQGNVCSLEAIYQNLDNISYIDSRSFDVIQKYFKNSKSWPPTTRERLIAKMTNNYLQTQTFLNRGRHSIANKCLLHLKPAESESKAVKLYCSMLACLCVVPFLMMTAMVLNILSTNQTPKHA